ncbi:histidinol-phosphatase [bacterium]|nr:histidinol-phosphatase [bacterium]
MNICRIFVAVLCAVLLFSPYAGTEEKTSWRVTSSPKEEVSFPDILGYETLLCDLHMHTVFSDGNVWPTVRVDEAWRLDLDVISISDHIEYLPHVEDIPKNHNRSYEIASPHAKVRNILMPRATEITRDTPPGHFNAIFLKDVDPLDNEVFLGQIETANEQGAFVFWNHQGWKGEERGSWRDVHTTMFEKKWLHGMEVCNGGSYYPSAHKWCVEKNMTMLGTSDIHAPGLLLKNSADEHRTITLVFAKDKTLPSVKEALFAGRTAVWYENQLIGRQEFLKEVFHEALEIEEPYLAENNTYYLEMKNTADIELVMERTGAHGPASMTIPPKSTIQLRVKTEGGLEEIDLEYTVNNFLVSPGTGLPVEFTVDLE